jgi:hypothetical protein
MSPSSRPGRSASAAWAVMAVAGVATLPGCLDFGSAYKAFCSGGACQGSSDGGGGEGACLGFGARCTQEGDCCVDGGAGAPMACGPGNACQETARDCREGGFSCRQDSQCCTNHCDDGWCRACGSSATDACATAADCCAPYTCLEGRCRVYVGFGNAADGLPCHASAFCASRWCEASPTVPNDGVCVQPAGCSGLGDAGVCCPGLAPAASEPGACCEPDDAWCLHDEDCCGGRCAGYRCSAARSARLGDRCRLSYDCPAGSLCNPASGTCVRRWCLSPPLSPWSGCCSWTTTSAPCGFPDGGQCVLPGNDSPTQAGCCSGAWVQGSTSCTELGLR